MRKLASIQTIAELNPIAGADKIEVARVLGWYLVVKKDDFKVGDLCIFCEVDSFLPAIPEFEFLRKSCYRKMADGFEGFRIKTIRLKNTVSQGLLLPLSFLEKYGRLTLTDSGYFLEC